MQFPYLYFNICSVVVVVVAAYYENRDYNFLAKVQSFNNNAKK